MPGDTKIIDPDLKRLRALRMIEMRIKGVSMKDIAKEFGVHPETVKRTLSWAKKAELVVQAEDRILQTLLPAAETAIQAVLAGTDDEVKAKTALEIFKATLPSFGKPKVLPGAPVAGPDSDLASYINSIRDAAALTDNTVDGELAPGPGGAALQAQLALPPAEAEPPAEGLPVPSEGDESAAESARGAVDSE